jgi:fructose-specific phosphotransferase system IIC component
MAVSIAVPCPIDKVAEVFGLILLRKEDARTQAFVTRAILIHPTKFLPVWLGD